MEKNLAVIGAGRWGKNLIRTIRANHRANLTAVASRNPETKLLVGNETHIFSDWRELLDQQIDGLVVAVPPALQEEIALAAIGRGIPLLLEKPLALSVKSAEAIRASAEKKSVPVLVDHIHIFHPAYLALKEYVKGAQAKVKCIRSEGGNQGPFRKGFSALWDYGAHDLAMAVDLMGEGPRILECRLERDENYSVVGEFSGGVRFSFRVGNQFSEKVRSFAVDLGSETVLFNDMAEEKVLAAGKPLAFSQASPLSLCLDVFLLGLEGKLDERWGLELGVEVVKCLERCEALLASS
jgi:predicted dehydrogenase